MTYDSHSTHELDDVWFDATQFLKTHLSPSGYQTFHTSCVPVSFEHSILTIEVSSDFSKKWIKEHCEPLLIRYFGELGYPDFLIHYTIHKPAKDHEQLNIFTPAHASSPETPPDFNQKYTFDNFIVGHNNRFAHAASIAVAKAPAKAYNPLFIYGSVGLGKTHLLNAIANDISIKQPHLTVKLVSSEKFTNELINSIKDKKVDQFRAKYRHVDVLIVDDIQFLAGKEQTQVEFFHTFNDLHSNNKQIILSSDRTPKEIPALELRLRTRFEWGLTADIQPPEFETRVAILRTKVEQSNFEISDEILTFIANQIPSNVREMEGCLTRIVAYASLLNTDITLNIASNVIKDMLVVNEETPLTISHIKRKVADYLNIEPSDLNSKSRVKDIVFARQVAMYLARELTNVSLPKIGEQFGKRDHSTVMHACDKIRTLLEHDSDTQQLVKTIITNIRG